MALWVAISISLGCLLLGFCLSSIKDDGYCRKLEAQRFEARMELNQLRVENDRLIEAKENLESIVNVVAEEAA